MDHTQKRSTSFNKTLLGAALLSVTLFAQPTFAANMMQATSSIQLPNNGLTFNSVKYMINDKTKSGYIVFNPQSPVASPANSKAPQLPRSNTVGALKIQLTKTLNHQLAKEKKAMYAPITSKDIAIYGGPFLNTANSFTDRKVLAALPNGEPYRVKITLSPKNQTDIVQAVIQGNFTIFSPPQLENLTIVENGVYLP